MRKLLLILSFCSALAAQNSGLEQLYTLTLQNNHQLRSQEERGLQKTYEERQIWGNLLPQVGFSLSYNQLNAPLEMDLAPLREAIIGSSLITGKILTAGSPGSTQTLAALKGALESNLPGSAFNKQLKAESYPQGTLSASWPLFTGGKVWYGVQATRERAGATRAEQQKLQNETLREVTASYLNLLLVKELIKTREQVLSGTARHLQQAKKLYQSGLAPKTVLLRAEVALNEAERNLSEERSKLPLLYLSLKNLTGVLELSLEQDSLPRELQRVPEEQLEEQSYRAQPLLQMLQSNSRALEYKYLADRGDYLPQLALFGKYELFPAELSALEPKWAVGAALTIKLFDGLKNYQQLEIDQSQKRELEQLERYSTEKLSLWLKKSRTELRNCEERYQRLFSALELARENLRLTEVRFATGSSTSLEVIDARLNLEKQLLERAVTLYNYYQAAADLYLAAGESLAFKELLK